MRFMIAALVGVFSINSQAAMAEDLAETATRFGALRSISDIALSPSGNKILYVQPGQNADEAIYIVDLTTTEPPKALLAFNEATSRLAGCYWANEERILCNVYGYQEAGGIIYGVTRYVGIDSKTGKSTVVTRNGRLGRSREAQDGGRLLAIDVPGKDNQVLMTRRYIKEASNNTRIFNDREGLGVDLVNIDKGNGRTIEKPAKLAFRYLADENGRVRIMGVRDAVQSGRDGNDIRYLYRTKDANDWEQLSVIDMRGDLSQGLTPMAVDSSKNVAYGFERVGGFQNLVSVKLDGTGSKETIVSRDDVDVDGLVRIGRKQRVIGASYATVARNVVYFDPELNKLADGLNKALPGKPLISILDTSEDESKIMLAASSDIDPGMIYLFDKGTGALEELLPVRAELAGRKMAPMKPITFPAADGTQIPGFLTLPIGSDGKNIPAVVLPHGGPGARDVWGFDWLVQFLAARGYAVLQPNFRGSAGYGEDWFGRNGFKAWRTAIGDVNDAGKWLVTEGIANPDQMGIMGWSYGGYAALQSQVVDPNLFKAVVAIAPVSDLNLLKEENRPYTSFDAVQRFVGSGPHIAEGSPARHAEAFKAPVLLVHGTMDTNTSVMQSKRMKSRLEGAGKTVEYVEFDGLDHYLVHAQARAIMLKRIATFLDANLPSEN